MPALVVRLREMSDRQSRHRFDIGDYWNAVEEAADRIEELEIELATARQSSAVAIGRRGGLVGGRSTSEAKQRASRENGKKNLPKKPAEEAS